MNFKVKRSSVLKKGLIYFLCIILVAGMEGMLVYAAENSAISGVQAEDGAEPEAAAETEEAEKEPVQTVSGNNIMLLAANFDVETADYKFSPDTGILTIKTDTGTSSWRNDKNISRDDVREAVVEDGVTRLREQSFCRCNNLVKVTLPESVTSLGKEVFGYSTNLADVTIPSGLTEIPDYTFSGCSSLRNMTLPPGITRIGISAFSSCKSLTEVVVPSKVKTVDRFAFGSCRNLERISFPEGLETVGEYALQYCEKLEEVYLPESITALERGVFYACAGLKKVNLPKSTTVIGESMFANCSSLERIVIPKNVTQIDMIAFFGCTNLKTVIFLPDALPVLGQFVFANTNPNYYKPPNKDYADTLTYVEYEPLVSQPESRTAVKGEAVTFSVEADGLDITYQWQKKDASGIWQDITGAAGKDYTIISADLSAAGSYQCVVTGKLVEEFDAVSQTSDTAVLKLENSWTVPLSMQGWTYGESANSPAAEAAFGQIVYSYRSSDNVSAPDVPHEAGTWYVEAKVTGTDNYTGLEAEKSFTISKATADITAVPSVPDITYGQKLSDSRLSGGTASAAGTFAWEDGSQIPTVADSGKTDYSVVFTPADAKNWNSIVIPVKITVNKAPAAPHMPETAMAASSGQNTVGEVVLPAGWKWKDGDGNKELSYQTGVTATAVYDGADKGNYVMESIEVVVTKNVCFHPAEKQEIRNSKEASCTEEGYTGNIFCTDCQSMTGAGAVIAALGHDYEQQVKVEPTTSSEGVMTYRCKRCNNSYDSVIERLPEDSGNGDSGNGSGDGGNGDSGNGSGGSETENGISGSGNSVIESGSNGTNNGNGVIGNSGINSIWGNERRNGKTGGSNTSEWIDKAADKDSGGAGKEEDESGAVSGELADTSLTEEDQHKQEKAENGAETEMSGRMDEMGGEEDRETGDAKGVQDIGRKETGSNIGSLLFIAAIGIVAAGGLFFWLLLWKRRKKEDENADESSGKNESMK